MIIFPRTPLVKYSKKMVRHCREITCEEKTTRVVIAKLTNQSGQEKQYDDAFVIFYVQQLTCISEEHSVEGSEH